MPALINSKLRDLPPRIFAGNIFKMGKPLTTEQKLPVPYLLFTVRGRISRATYWQTSIFIWCSFYVLFSWLNHFGGLSATWLLYPPFFWSVLCTSSKRLHDTGKSGFWLL